MGLLNSSKSSMDFFYIWTANTHGITEQSWNTKSINNKYLFKCMYLYCQGLNSIWFEQII